MFWKQYLRFCNSAYPMAFDEFIISNLCFVGVEMSADFLGYAFNSTLIYVYQLFEGPHLNWIHDEEQDHVARLSFSSILCWSQLHGNEQRIKPGIVLGDIVGEAFLLRFNCEQLLISPDDRVLMVRHLCARTVSYASRLTQDTLDPVTGVVKVEEILEERPYLVSTATFGHGRNLASPFMLGFTGHRNGRSPLAQSQVGYHIL